MGCHAQITATAQKEVNMAVPDDNDLSSYPLQEKSAKVGEPLNKVAWSYSKRSTLEQCARRYYYEYFGANKKTAKGEKAKDTLHFLKGVQNRYERAGAILHLVIRVYYQKAQAGNIWSLSRTIGWARDLFRADVKHSRQHPDGSFIPQVPFPPTLLREYYYQLPDSDVLCSQTEDKLIQSLQTFFDDQFEEFRVCGASKDAVIEGKLSLSDFPCKVSGQVDLAYKNGSIVKVIDWKLGGEEGTGDDSLQLAVYGLWALNHFKCLESGLQVMKVHLSSGEISPFRADAEVLGSARTRIIQDAERIAVMNYYGSLARIEAFSPCLYPSICRLCSFEKVCYA